MSQLMLARYYWLPTNRRLSFCTVESGSSSHDDSAIVPAYPSLARATTRLMVRACARPVLQEHQHTLLIVLTIFVWHFFVNLPYHLWRVVHVHIKRSDVTMVRRRKMFCEIISQVFEPWCPYYTVCVQIYLIDQPKILAVHRSRELVFYCAVADPSLCIIIHKDCGWALLPTHLFQGEA